MTIERLETQRTLGRPIAATDFDDLLLLRQDERASATLGGPMNPGQVRTLLDRHRMHWREHGFGTYAIRLRGDEQWIGYAGLRRIELFDRAEVELLYMIRSLSLGPCQVKALKSDNARIRAGRAAAGGISAPPTSTGKMNSPSSSAASISSWM